MSPEAPRPADLSALRIHREPERRGGPRGWLLAGAALVVAAGVAAYVLAGRGLGPRKVEVVTAAVVTEGQATTLLSATGYVEAERKADLSPKITSRITELNVTEGTRVRKDEVIARLDSTDLDAQLAEAKANWVNADNERARQKSLYDAGPLAEVDLRRGRGFGRGDPGPRPLRGGAARLHGHPRAVYRRHHGQAGLRRGGGLALRFVAVGGRIGRGDRHDRRVLVALRRRRRQRGQSLEAGQRPAGRDHARRRSGQDVPRLSAADRPRRGPAESHGAGQGRVPRSRRPRPARPLGAGQLHERADAGP